MLPVVAFTRQARATQPKAHRIPGPHTMLPPRSQEEWLTPHSPWIPLLAVAAVTRQRASQNTVPPPHRLLTSMSRKPPSSNQNQPPLPVRFPLPVHRLKRDIVDPLIHAANIAIGTVTAKRRRTDTTVVHNNSRSTLRSHDGLQHGARM